ncbi:MULTISPECIES: tol-pal system YbgF family protein [unclassified Methylobacterium]
MELDSEIYNSIKLLSARGEHLVDRDRYLEAVTAFKTAIDLLPEPKEQWSAWTWLAAAIGDAYYLDDRFAEARSWFRAAVAGPDGLGNPFIHLRLGQTARRLGDEKRAVDELLRAYMGDGVDVFEDDVEDLAFLRAHVKL